MYSGQEIVSQEECKIVLAEFYEGVQCYNITDNTVKFVLQDWATATYDPVTFTLETRNFSCRPVIITEDIRITFEAAIPDGTTGLEVHMHTAEYERVRIMPLIYLPICSTLDWDWDYPTTDYGSWAYVNNFCNTATHTTLEILGVIDSVTTTMITATGYSDDVSTGTAILSIEFLDDLDQVMTITPDITTETRDITSWEWDETSQTFEEVITQKEVVLISVGLAKSIRYSGLYDYTATLYDCATQTVIGSVISLCNLTVPEYETRITSSTDIYVEEDGWFKLSDDTEFRLLPTMNFKRLEGTTYFFEGADQIEYRVPTTNTYDIFKCFDDPVTYDTFYQYPMFYYENGWKLKIYLYGSYTIDTYNITNDVTGEIYRYFETNTTIIDLVTNATFEDNILSVPVLGDCSVFYTVDNGPQIDIPNVGVPFDENYRTVWDQTKCKFIVTCESIGWFPCPCIACEPEPDGESVHIFTSGEITDTCTKDGLEPQVTSISGCNAGSFFAFGSYPDIPAALPGIAPVASQGRVNHIYFNGLQMYMALPTLVGFTYYVPIGNLAYGTDLYEIEDTATDKKATVEVLPFIYLDLFKIPYRYIKPYGLDTNMWYDWDIFRFDGQITEEAYLLQGIYSSNSFDFAVDINRLQQTLPAGWSSGQFDWSNCCAWVSASTNRPALSLDKIITVNNTDELDGVNCIGEMTTKYYYSNIRLGNVRPPVGASGAFQSAYEEYAKTIDLLVSKQSEAFALQEGLYQQDLNWES